MFEEYDLEDAICFAETFMDDRHEWHQHTKELDNEDKRDRYDPVENYFFPPDPTNERRRRINEYLAREPKFVQRI